MNINSINAVSSYNVRGFNNPLKKNFKSNEQHIDDDKQNSYDHKQFANTITFIASMAAVTGMSIMYGLSSWEQNKTLDKFEKVINDSEIRKDTFLVKDVTGDEKPDMVLFKKDGSKVVFDIANGNVK